MKKYCFLLLLILMSLCSCSNKDDNKMRSKADVTAVAEQQVTEAVETANILSTSISTTGPATTAASDIIETIESSSEVGDFEQTVEAIEYVCNDRWNGYSREPYIIYNGTEHITFENEIDYYMNNVSKIKNDIVGKIVSEQDLISKAREIFIDILGQEYIDCVEADCIINDGERVAITSRITPIYRVEYYKEYDVWYINPCMPSGITEDGEAFATIHDLPPFLIICGNDGRIIACRF
ncbi:MAG: hypothetical protein IJ496_07605 [Ruminococcus sp.]|nr:hypothetical protein [Ruminococcus sp.]